MTARPRRRGFASRLFLAQALVILAGAGTLGLVASAVAPRIFHSHINDSGLVLSQDARDHIDQAFDDAILLALVLAIAAALLAAIGVSAFLAVRLARPVTAVADAARTVAAGDYDTRVPPQGPDEVAGLAVAFNEMAEALAMSERRRAALMSDVAHELRTPLATVEGYLEGLGDGTIAPEAETWEVLRQATGRMHRLVEDLSAVSRAEERRIDLRTTRVPPAQLVDAAIRAARADYAAKGVELIAAADPAAPDVEVDPDRFAEVLGNLLRNALRHTPAGGRVEVGAAPLPSAVDIWVADTGEGIAPEHIERVFERFFRTDEARSRATGGSGIGLTIARATVEALGGRIWAESAGLGSGARFVVRMPVAVRRTQAGGTRHRGGRPEDRQAP